MTITEILNATPLEREVYQARMSAAWKRVKPPGNWKGPVDAILIEPNADRLQDVLDAVEFFTATKATLWEVDNLGLDVYRVTSPGYYAGPAN